MLKGKPTQFLIEQARAGDRSAFEELNDRFRNRVLSEIEFIIRSRHLEALEPEEILQETFVQAYRSIDRFAWRGNDSFYLWLCGIARNVLLNLARNARRNRSLDSPDQVPGQGASPSRVMRRNERMDRLESALSKLPLHYREVLRLSRLEGLPVKEIAARINRTEYAVRHLLARAVMELKKHFGETESIHLPDRILREEGEENGKD